MESLREDWDWTKKTAEGFYDTINASYELEKLRFQFNKAANSATNVKVQQAIRDLQAEELAMLEEKDKLSEYDIKRAQKRLDIL
jgi:hypothetical protein